MNSNGFASYFQFSNVNWANMGQATWETIWMTVVSIIVVTILGILLGLVLFETNGSSSILIKILNWIVAAFVKYFSIDSIYYPDCLITTNDAVDYGDDYWTTSCITVVDHFGSAVLRSLG